jgi:hypothetical protein
MESMASDVEVMGKDDSIGLMLTDSEGNRILAMLDEDEARTIYESIETALDNIIQ